MGTTAQGGGDRRCRRASRVQGPADLRLSRAPAAEGGRRRRQEPVRCGAISTARASRCGGCEVGLCDDRARQRAPAPDGEAAALARDRQRGLHRFASGAGVARPRPDGRRPRQLRHRPPAQRRRDPRGGDRRAMAPPPLHRGRHPRSRRLPERVPRHRRRAAPGGAGIGSALARRSDRDQRRRTSTVSSTCWSPRATPACGASSTRRPARPMATTPALPKVEDAIGRPLSPYAVTKLVNELYAEVFARCYGVQSIGLRYFNIFGARQDPDGAYAAVIPRWIRAMLVGEEVVDQRRRRDEPRLLLTSTTRCRRTCWPRSPTIPAAVNQVYNVAVDDRTSLNRLFQLLRDAIATRLPGAGRRDAGLPRLPAGRRPPLAGRHRQGAAAARLCADASAGRRHPRGDAVVSGALRRRAGARGPGGRRHDVMAIRTATVEPDRARPAPGRRARRASRCCALRRAPPMPNSMATRAG